MSLIQKKAGLIKQIRQNAARFSFLRWLRHNAFTVNIVRPILNNNKLHKWWANEWPAPPPHIEKMNLLLCLANQINAKCFIETGSYMGDTIRHMKNRFDKLYSLELADFFAAPLIKEFKNHSNVEIIVGDSAKTLPKIIGLLNQPTLFWLDAHFSGGDTEGGSFVPTTSEIITISGNMKASHIIAIDDMINFNGENGYPTVKELEGQLTSLGYRTTVFSNIMQAVKII